MDMREFHAWDMNGGGTSASTPQIAAACALWLGHYGTLFPKRDWTRVAACRYALFAAVADRELNVEEIGVGALNSVGMLDDALARELAAEAASPPPQGKLRHADPDKDSWPFIRLLFGLPPAGSGIDEMLDKEAQHLALRSTNPRLQDVLGSEVDGDKVPAQEAGKLRDDFLREPDMSVTLREVLLMSPKMHS